MPEFCDTCKAPIVWAVTPKGARSPIDAVPDPEKGNTLLLAPTGFGGALAVVLSGRALTRARGLQMELRLNHWATCPDKEEWRERTDQRRRAAAASD